MCRIGTGDCPMVIQHKAKDWGLGARSRLWEYAGSYFRVHALVLTL